MRIIEIVIQPICALLLIAGIAVNFSNVVGRYLFSQPLSWAEDFMVYSNVWVIFLGAGLATCKNRHLSMDLVQTLLPHGLRQALVVAMSITAFISCAVTAWISSQFVARMVASGQRSISLDVPMYIPHASVALGFGLMTIAFGNFLYRLVFVRPATADAASEAALL